MFAITILLIIMSSFLIATSSMAVSYYNKTDKKFREEHPKAPTALIILIVLSIFAIIMGFFNIYLTFRPKPGMSSSLVSAVSA